MIIIRRRKRNYMRHVPLSLTSTAGENVGHSESLPSFDEDGIIGEAVTDIKLGMKDVGLTVSTPDCDGGADSEGVVKGDDFVMQSSLLT